MKYKLIMNVKKNRQLKHVLIKQQCKILFIPNDLFSKLILNIQEFINFSLESSIKVEFLPYGLIPSFILWFNCCLVSPLVS